MLSQSHFSIRFFFSGLVAALMGCCASAICEANVTLPNIFSDHMVLQRNQENKVWGKADPGEAIEVNIANQSQKAKADEQGMWHVMLAPMQASTDLTLTVRGKNNSVELADVAVGEVWICSGQSNMAWKVASAEDADLEKLSGDHPGIRMINFPQVGSQEPIWEHEQSSWMVCSPETVSNFSAVGYFFGRQLNEILDVPVGLINNAWGGSACEAWISRDVLQSEGQFAELLKRSDAAVAQFEQLSSKNNLGEAELRQLEQLRRQVTGNQRPANIYNGVLKSHLGYGIRGAIWYQGESNAGRAYQYRELFPLMISSWRNEWQQGDFPFYWVQLADYREEVEQPAESDWAELREAQTMTLSKLPNVGQAVIIDIGEGKDIHPQNKLDVGKRLARLALDDVYDFDLASRSPTFSSMKKENGKIVLTFDDVDGGWRPFDINNPIGFSIAGEDKQFVWANAEIRKDNSIVVSSDKVSDPVAVRYGWADNPRCNLFDKAGLPLTPFRTDDWPGVTAGRN